MSTHATYVELITVADGFKYIGTMQICVARMLKESGIFFVVCCNAVAVHMKFAEPWLGPVAFGNCRYGFYPVDVCNRRRGWPNRSRSDGTSLKDSIFSMKNLPPAE